MPRRDLNVSLQSGHAENRFSLESSWLHFARKCMTVQWIVSYMHLWVSIYTNIRHSSKHQQKQTHSHNIHTHTQTLHHLADMIKTLWWRWDLNRVCEKSMQRNYVMICFQDCKRFAIVCLAERSTLRPLDSFPSISQYRYDAAHQDFCMMISHVLFHDLCASRVCCKIDMCMVVYLASFF